MPGYRILPVATQELRQMFFAAEREEYRNFQRANPFINFHLVLNTGSLKVEVFSDEHPPPHFRVKYQNMSANFSIIDCERLNGDLTRRDREVKKWWLIYRSAIAEAWNYCRPTDCPVGLVDVSALGWKGS